MKLFNRKKEESIPICQSCQNLIWYNKKQYKCVLFHIWGSKEDCPIWCKDYKEKDAKNEG